MKISEHIDKNNLHHAYLIEGGRDEIVPEILKFCEDINVKTSGNPDFVNIVIDNFKKDEAFELRSMSSNKSFSSSKKIFVISVNTFSPDAEGILLKMFEEPIENTHFFLIVPDINALLKTLVSRFYIIKTTQSLSESKNADKFISMTLSARIDFMKEFLATDDDEEEMTVTDSVRSKSLRFLNALESNLHNYFVSKDISDTRIFEQIFKVRKFLRMPGSSTKSLMESIALITPIL